jgi:alkanesulfonate monooxygenase SsuD/methylene tetrahydromethanopterin reductase-like flavin-dependent oxidoreductase (luciferase family)
MWLKSVTSRRGSIKDQRQLVEAMRRALAEHSVDIDGLVRAFVAIGKDPEDLEDPLDEMTSVLAGGAPLWHPRDIERVARASRAVAAILQKLGDHLDVNEMLRALDKTEVSISLYVEEVENLEALEHPAYLEDPNALLADLRKMESELEELTASAAPEC